MSAVTLFPAQLNLDGPSRIVNRYLERDRNLHKVALLIDHIIRAAMMTAFMLALPLTPLASFAVGLAASVFYRITVEEKNCTLRFAMPAWFGGCAMGLARRPMVMLVNRIAFASLTSFAVCLAGFLPVMYWFAAVSIQVDQDLKRKFGPLLGFEMKR